ncbi:UDP-glycosyltransferase 91C1-like [Ziziphus jujuba]|uniref:UDP-glycosyltransferase 91C1-like n=1 Tax=Ziziphus jujuba TaxID=326968 RepID=A0A6P3ZUS6_ZIZJJ|nr:UDP-glycosyltransferase 91C1-like [Ziziphus jujuba]
MEELMMKKENKFHIALFPWLAYGHLLPYLEVSKLLAEKGYRVTFISTPKNIRRLPKLHQALSDSCLINFVELPLPEVDGLPNGVESTADISIQKVPYLKKAYDMLQPSLIHFLQASDVNWIIHDFVCYWVPQVATQLGINSIFFHITNATSLAFVGPPSELTGGQRQKPEDFTVVPKWIDFPSNEAFKLHEMVSHWDCMDRDVADFERFAHAIQGCQFVTMRTCPKFEADSLSLLQKLYGKPAVPIGFLPPHHSNSVQGDDDEIKWKTLKEWLDNNKHRSVFYIAFGTEVSLSRDMMHELAYGIEKSRLPFIWVLNNRPLVEGLLGSDHIIPPEFEAQVSERGLIWRGWAPQLRILAHSSIGGFLTHCGWGSVIEALGFGLPLILFSGASADQGLIARLMQERGVGLEIPRDDKTGSFTSDSVAKLIRRVMVDQEGESVRANAWAIRDIFGNVELNNRCLDEFIKCLETFAA